jgi:hypothetical protein
MTASVLDDHGDHDAATVLEVQSVNNISLILIFGLSHPRYLIFLMLVLDLLNRGI